MFKSLHTSCGVTLTLTQSYHLDGKDLPQSLAEMLTWQSTLYNLRVSRGLSMLAETKTAAIHRGFCVMLSLCNSSVSIWEPRTLSADNILQCCNPFLFPRNCNNSVKKWLQISSSCLHSDLFKMREQLSRNVFFDHAAGCIRKCQVHRSTLPAYTMSYPQIKVTVAVA